MVRGKRRDAEVGGPPKASKKAASSEATADATGDADMLTTQLRDELLDAMSMKRKLDLARQNLADAREVVKARKGEVDDLEAKLFTVLDAIGEDNLFRKALVKRIEAERTAPHDEDD
jgi:hypothetical protein